MGIVKKFRIKSFKEQETLVELKKISMFYNKRQILDDINLKINKQEVLGILGTNGVGKSTIFKIINWRIRNEIHIVEEALKVNIMIFDIGSLPVLKTTSNIYRSKPRFTPSLLAISEFILLFKLGMLTLSNTLFAKA